MLHVEANVLYYGERVLLLKSVKKKGGKLGHEKLGEGENLQHQLHEHMKSVLVEILKCQSRER